eukprot:484587-Rhodomonas_salina.1
MRRRELRSLRHFDGIHAPLQRLEELWVAQYLLLELHPVHPAQRETLRAQLSARARARARL